MDPYCANSLCTHSTALMLLNFVGVLLLVGVAAVGSILLFRITQFEQEIEQEKRNLRSKEQ